MRTTIDLPDSLFRQVKSTAAGRGLKLKEFVAEALVEALKPSGAGQNPEQAHREKMKAHLEAMRKDRIQTGPVGSFNREELYDRND